MKRTAFTLVELIATMTVLSALAGVSAMLIARAGTAISETRARGDSMSAAGWAIDRMLREIRGVPSAPTGGPGIVEATATTLEFTSGLRISLEGDRVVMEDPTGPQPLCEHVSALEFAYLDAEGATLDPQAGDPPSDIRRITVRLAAGGIELRGLAVPRAGFEWRPMP